MKEITGVMFYYYHVCKRKLWYFKKGITCEHENDDVTLGKFLDSNSYKRDKKGILIDESINIDFIRDWEVIHEIKKSKAVEEASIWQVKYYLYFLKERGFNVKKGILDYPKLRERREVVLSEEDETKVKETLTDIQKVTKLKKPPETIDLPLCKRCSYYDLCYI